MVMRTLSRNRRSFDATSQALCLIDKYLLNRRHEDIDEADRNIEEAVKADSDYALAIFYRGVVHDLCGTPADAVHYFTRIMRECKDDDLKMKSQFNLGVAYYHQYSHRWLAKAEECFHSVIKDAQDKSLVVLAKSLLAQTHAMWMRPSNEQDGKNPDVQSDIKSHFAQCEQIIAQLPSQAGITPQVEAMAANAWGIANMYITDHLATVPAQKGQHLAVAKESLQKAEECLPNDWAITCNLGSLSLRMGVRARETLEENPDEHFAKATEHLERVINDLRPGYGFALYELGIIHRVWQKWIEARDFQKQAMEIPERYRDISDKGLEKQLERIASQDSEYP